MDLFESINGAGNIRGITLNTQCMDLFNIIEEYKSKIKDFNEEEKSKYRNEAIDEVVKYLNDILLCKEQIVGCQS